jgi:hypothetical protein
MLSLQQGMYLQMLSWTNKMSPKTNKQTNKCNYQMANIWESLNKTRSKTLTAETDDQLLRLRNVDLSETWIALSPVQYGAGV